MTHHRFWIVCLLLTFGLASLSIPSPAQARPATTYTVTNTADSGAGSLRWAINQANANAGPDTIAFNIAGCGGVCTISPASALPILTDDGTTIDGYTQPGSSPPGSATPAVILIEIDGTNVPNNSGLNIASANNVVRGLAINRFGWNGIAIGYPTAHDNVIVGNHIGTNAAGTAALGNGAEGVSISLGAWNNTVGGDTAEERNVISGNGWGGVAFHGSDTTGNMVVGNHIGTDAAGTAALGNTLYGVRIYGGAHDNAVFSCFISGNTGDGVRIAGHGTDNNYVFRNAIGLTTLGAALGNGGDGVQITLGARGNVVGGEVSGLRNVISANSENGVVISGTNTMSNTVSGNYIGTTGDGSGDLGNLGSGVLIGGGAGGNTVGGDSIEERNVISGNDGYGVSLTGPDTANNTVSGNYIGVNAAGTAALANGGGILVTAARDNTIGGTGPGQGNVVSGNTWSGILLIDPGTTGNAIAGNYIGTDPSGASAIANGENGISIYQQACGNTVGPGNVVSGNTGDGIVLGVLVTGTRILGNLVGTNAAGTAALGNGDSGIALDWASSNTIGGDLPALRNVISGNGYGVVIGGDSRGNTVTGNYIGTDVSGTADLGNTRDGVVITGGASNNVIGGDTAGERNVIAGNDDDGVALEGATGNVIRGNYIGTDAGGTTALGNADFGMYIGDGAQSNTIGGTAAGEGNVISNSGRDGIYVAGSDTAGNVIAGNSIGTDAGGTMDMGNGQEGIELDFGTHGNTIGPANVIAHNASSGVLVDDSTIVDNDITQNSIFANAGLGIELVEGAHGGIAAPVITGVVVASGSVEIHGTACSGCTVEVFVNGNTDGEGEVYIGSTVADGGGNFTLTVASLAQPYLTATATDAADGTSEFSSVFTAAASYVVYLPIVARGQ